LMTKSLFRVLILVLLSIVPGLLQAQNNKKPLTRILFMLDASQSMSNNWVHGSKIQAAKQILSDLVDSLKNIENLQMALRIYGHQSYYSLHDCQDTKLEVGFRPGNHIYIKSKLRTIQPKGITPIAYALERAEKDFPSYRNVRNIIILITDGEESCEGDPCAVSRALQEKQVILRPFVIGLSVSSSLQTRLDCIGSYYNASSPEGFKGILHAIIKSVLSQTTTQVDLLDEEDRPTETDVNMTFMNEVSHKVEYNYYHTFNTAGYSDTLLIDPLNRYDLIIHTLPPVRLNDIEIVPNMHNKIEVPTPQGDLQLLMQGDALSSYQQDIKCLVTVHGEDKTVNVQNINSTERYLTGYYDLEILTLPRIRLENIQISERSTTSIRIPNPGLVTFYSSIEIYGGIFTVQDNQMVKIYQLNNRILKETVALQPGTYYVIYRSKLARDMNSTITKKFVIESGESKTIKL